MMKIYSKCIAFLGFDCILLVIAAYFYGVTIAAALLALATGVYFSGFNNIIGSYSKRNLECQKLSEKIENLQKRLDKLKL